MNVPRHIALEARYINAQSELKFQISSRLFIVSHIRNMIAQHHPELQF